MASNMTLLFILLIIMTLSSSVMSADIPAVRSQDLVVAMEEMQKANYFTFVMLINMSPLDPKLTGNVTFLMPKDKILARSNIFQDSINDFLLRHSIPTALHFENLQGIPSGSLIPSSLPDYMLKISNGGRKSFSLNNVKIISPNLCNAGSLIRCHGIDGVLDVEDDDDNNNNNNSSSVVHSCSNSSSTIVVATTPEASPQSSVIPSFSSPLAPLIAPQTSDSSSLRSAGSVQRLSFGGLFNFLFLVATLSKAGVF